MILRKLWHWIASPSRGIAAGALLFAGGVVGVVFLGGVTTAIQFTNHTEFCISCHKGIAHHLPDIAQGYKQVFADLQAEATKTSAKAGDVLYPLATKPLFIEKPASADNPPDGRLIAATPVTVLAADGDWLQV